MNVESRLALANGLSFFGRAELVLATQEHSPALGASPGPQFVDLVGEVPVGGLNRSLDHEDVVDTALFYRAALLFALRAATVPFSTRVGGGTEKLRNKLEVRGFGNGEIDLEPHDVRRNWILVLAQ